MAKNSEKYPVEVFWSEEDEGFIAIAPDLPGCSAWGETESEALSQLREAESAWINAAKEAGNPIPKASKPAALSEYSGKILLRIPKLLHASLAKDAKEDGISLNQYMVYLLTKNSAINETSKRISNNLITIFQFHSSPKSIPAMKMIQPQNEKWLYVKTSEEGQTIKTITAPNFGFARIPC